MRQANLKVILELTGSQCSSEWRAVASCCERLGKTMRATEVCKQHSRHAWGQLDNTPMLLFC